MHVLFVCTGNIFRSLTAERALRRTLGDRPGIAVSSAGTDDYPHEVWPVVGDYLRSRGYEVSDHRRRTLTRDILKGADLAVAMSTDHQEFIESRFGLRVPVYLEVCGEPAGPLPDIDEVIPDFRNRPDAVQAHVRFTIDRIIELAPRMAASLDKLKV